MNPEQRAQHLVNSFAFLGRDLTDNLSLPILTRNQLSHLIALTIQEAEAAARTDQREKVWDEVIDTMKYAIRVGPITDMSLDILKRLALGKAERSKESPGT